MTTSSKFFKIVMIALILNSLSCLKSKRYSNSSLADFTAGKSTSVALDQTLLDQMKRSLGGISTGTKGSITANYGTNAEDGGEGSSSIEVVGSQHPGPFGTRAYFCDVKFALKVANNMTTQLMAVNPFNDPVCDAANLADTLAGKHLTGDGKSPYDGVVASRVSDLQLSSTSAQLSVNVGSAIAIEANNAHTNSKNWIYFCESGGYAIKNVTSQGVGGALLLVVGCGVN